METKEKKIEIPEFLAQPKKFVTVEETYLKELENSFKKQYRLAFLRGWAEGSFCILSLVAIVFLAYVICTSLR